MEGSYFDPDVEGNFGPHIDETWSCIKNDKENCDFVLKNITKSNGS